MDTIAKENGANMRELFNPLIMARARLTNKCSDEAFTEWLDKLKQLHDKLDTEAQDIIYRVISILFYKHDAEIMKQNRTVDEIINTVGLDTIQYYGHYYNEEMQTVSIQSKAIEMLTKRNRILMEIAENKAESATARIKALAGLDSYIDSCLTPSGPKAINVYGQTAIDMSSGKQVAAFNLDKLGGQGDPDFKRFIRGAVQKKEEIDEIEVMANVLEQR